MPDRVTTSFIPKESLVSERVTKQTSKNPLIFINIVAGGILLAAVVASVGIFLLKTYTVQSIESKKVSLDRQRAAFEPATIEALLRLDKRINASSGLLKSHVALSLLFDDLEARTNTNVRYKNFKYEPGGSGRFLISMSGTAKSFNAVALQSDSFGKSTIIKDPIFSNLNLDQNGDVIFDFTGVIDTSRVSYAAAALSAVEPVPPIEP
jgi:hypothetical protein